MTKQRLVLKKIKKSTGGFHEPFFMKVRLTTISELLGTIPKNETVLKDFIHAKALKMDTKLKESDLNDETASPGDTLTDLEKKSWTGFMEEDGKPFILDYVIKGYLKDKARIMNNRNIKIKQLKSKVHNYVHILPRKIFIKGEYTELPLERPLRCETMQGPRTALAKSDQIKAGAVIEFKIESPIPSVIGPEEIEILLKFGKYEGLLQFRSGGYGKFEYEILEIGKLDEL